MILTSHRLKTFVRTIKKNEKVLGFFCHHGNLKDANCGNVWKVSGVNMSESSCSSITTITSNSSSSSSCLEPVDDIKRHLIGSLTLTARRQMFEEHLKTSEEEKKLMQDSEKSCLIEASTNRQIDLKVIQEISEFRRNNSKDCMSSYNCQRLKRTKEKEEQSFLQPTCDHRCLFYKDLIGSNKLTESKQTLGNEESQQSPLKTVRFTPDSSLALVHQKFKC